jgi:hypothetical protein
MRYAQGQVSVEFKALLRDRIRLAKTESDVEALLNDIHDSTLACRNSPDGLRKAVSVLRQIEKGE